jgi:predicted RNA-binding Zn ribbon-like protein
MAIQSDDDSNRRSALGLPPPMRIGDHLALDFLNTIAAPKGAPIEWIARGHDLVNWLVGVGALERASAERLTANCPSAQLDRVAEESIGLREWFRALLPLMKAGGGAGAMSPGDLDRLNRLLARDASYQMVEPAGDGTFHRFATRRWLEAGALLMPIAVAIAALFCEGDLKLVRRCENPLCTMWFYDRTKGHRRRWCSQAICGNRAKVAAFRERRRAEHPETVPLRRNRRRA